MMNPACIDAATLSLLHAPAPLSWLEPETTLTRPELRKQAQARLQAELSPVVLEHWAAQVPPSKHAQMLTRTRQGVAAAIKALLAASSSAQFGAYWTLWQRMLPNYWEPPVAAKGLDTLPEHQLRALRWTAALIALHVRNELEDLHAQFTGDAGMPSLNRGLRNTGYEALLVEPEIAWELSAVPRLMLDLQARGLPAEVPAVAG